MDEKGLVKKVGNKIGSGVLFVVACYVAMYILKEFSDNLVFVAIATVLLLVSAFLFLNALFAEKVKEWAPEEKEEAPSNGESGEFRLKATKYMKEMESTQKEMLEVLKKQNTLLQSQIENLEHEIYMLSEKQVNQAKSIIKFNKENARQLAISERETLEHIMHELKKAIEDNTVAAPAAVLEEVSEEDLFTVSDLPGDDEYVVPEVSVASASEPIEEPAEEVPVSEEVPTMEETLAVEEMEIPEMPADIEIPLPEETVPEPEPEAAPVPAVDPLAGLSSDPNAMMSPEDIAKLLASMGQ